MGIYLRRQTPLARIWRPYWFSDRSLAALSSLLISEDPIQLTIPGTPPNKLDWAPEELLNNDVLIYDEPEEFLPEDQSITAEFEPEGPRRRALLVC